MNDTLLKKASENNKRIRVATIILQCLLMLFSGVATCLIMGVDHTGANTLRQFFTSTWFSVLFVICATMLCVSLHRFTARTSILRYIILYLTLAVFMFVVIGLYLNPNAAVEINDPSDIQLAVFIGIFVAALGGPLMAVIAKDEYCICGKHHKWDGCICTRCGKVKSTLETGHDWDGCTCRKCGQINDELHTWENCVCTQCGKKRDQDDPDHAWSFCKCKKCGATRDRGHKWDGCVCTLCGAERPHEWGDDRRCKHCGTCNHEMNEEWGGFKTTCKWCGYVDEEEVQRQIERSYL